MHFLMMSQSEPQEARFILCCTMMSFNWERTSRTCRRTTRLECGTTQTELKDEVETEGSSSESDLAHGLGVDEVVIAPNAGVIVVLPLRVHVQVGEVVALRDGELLPHLVAFLFTTLQRHTIVVFILRLFFLHLLHN